MTERSVPRHAYTDAEAEALLWAELDENANADPAAIHRPTSPAAIPRHAYHTQRLLRSVPTPSEPEAAEESTVVNEVEERPRTRRRAA